MNKVKLKKRKVHKLGNILTLTITLVLISTFFLLSYFNTKVNPILMTYAESETRKLTTLIINKAITKQIASNMEIDNLFTVSKNNDGEIQLIDFNTITVTKILNAITNLVQLNLKSIEEGDMDLLELPDNTLSNYDEKLLRHGIIYELPVGTITGNAFLSNLGPKIPLRLDLIGDVTTDLSTKVTEYGLNNALLEVNVTVNVTSRINLPFISKKVELSTSVPIAMKVIQGTIPNIYQGGFLTTGSVASKKID